MNIRIFLCFLAAVFAVNLYASDIERAEDIELEVRKMLTSFFENEYGELTFKENYALKVSRLDKRLALQKCPIEKQLDFAHKTNGTNHMTVKVSCNAGKRWSIYVPARLEKFASIAVAASNLPRGHIITNKDVKMTRQKVSTLGISYADSVNAVVGKQLKRSIRSGDLLKSSVLGMPKIVSKGEKVKVVSTRGNLLVSANAMALETGELGEMISVQNTRSARVLDARVVGPGRVRVIY